MSSVTSLTYFLISNLFTLGKGLIKAANFLGENVAGKTLALSVTIGKMITMKGEHLVLKGEKCEGTAHIDPQKRVVKY